MSLRYLILWIGVLGSCPDLIAATSPWDEPLYDPIRDGFQELAPSFENAHVILIGVNQYKPKDEGEAEADHWLINLKGAVHDVDGFDTFFKQVFEHLKLPDRKPVVLKNDGVTKVSIKNSLGQVGQQGEVGLLLVLFSGHGLMDGGIPYLGMHGTRKDELPETGLALSEFLTWFEDPRLQVNHRVLIMDACVSGSALSASLQLQIEKAQQGTNSVYILASHGSTADTAQGGYLAQGMLRGFKGYAGPTGDPNESSRIKLNGAYDYATNEIRCRDTQDGPIIRGKDTGIVVYQGESYCDNLERDILRIHSKPGATHRSNRPLQFEVEFMDKELADWSLPKLDLVWQINGGLENRTSMDGGSQSNWIFTKEIKARGLHHGNLIYHFEVVGRAACLGLRTEICRETIHIRM